MSGPSNETENEKRLERIAVALERSAEATEKIAKLLSSVTFERRTYIGTTADGQTVTEGVGNFIAVGDL